MFDGGTRTFQVGSEATDTLTLSFANLSSADLGASGDVSAINVNSLTTGGDASAAIAAIDTAISSISSQRAELGATQNRLEHTVKNLSVSVENLSAAESRIRDTDMAAEMVSFTRNQIMQQAGTAMLAQANAVPQSVLGLLQ